jgi:hypothetical protein
MAKLRAADYENVLDMIESISKAPQLFPAYTCRKYVCGFTVAQCIASFRNFFPANTSTDDQLTDLLVRGSRSGVFNVVCANAVVPTEATCGVPGDPLYSVNQQMTQDPRNRIYAAAFNTPAPPQPLPFDVNINYPIDATTKGSYFTVANASGGIY